jgi:hypothetical protein
LVVGLYSYPRRYRFGDENHLEVLAIACLGLNQEEGAKESQLIQKKRRSLSRQQSTFFHRDAAGLGCYRQRRPWRRPRALSPDDECAGSQPLELGTVESRASPSSRRLLTFSGPSRRRPLGQRRTCHSSGRSRPSRRPRPWDWPSDLNLRRRLALSIRRQSVTASRRNGF